MKRAGWLSAKLLIAISRGAAIFPRPGSSEIVKKSLLLSLACAVCLSIGAQTPPPSSNSAVRLRITYGTTLVGNIDIELFDSDKPVTVSNFLAYVQSRRYDNSILHRCDPGFILQGGGWTVPSPQFAGGIQTVSRVPVFPAITNEFFVGQRYSNTVGTIAMVRDGTNLNSARSEWFFNLVNNSPHLDTNAGGYVVFGRVTNGLAVLNFFNNLSESANILNMMSPVYQQTCPPVYVNPDDVFDYPFAELPIAALPFGCPIYAHLFAVQAIMLSGPDVLPPKVTVNTPKKFATLTNENVTLTGSSSDNVRVASVRVALGANSVTTSNVNPWSLTLTNVPPGTNVVLVEAVDSTGNRTQIPHTFFRSVRVPFSLTQIGEGKVTGPTNNSMLEVGRGYSLIARPARGYLFGGWSGSNNFNLTTLKFIMQSNHSLTATFVTNLFPYVKGTYNGLFHDTTMVEQFSSGFFTMTVGDAGAYSGKLLLNGKSHSLKGTLWVDGTGTNTVVRPGTNALRVTMALDLTNGTDRITGLVSEETSSNTVWSVDLVADRAVFGGTNTTALAGKYTMIIPADTNSTNGPFGNGYGAVSVSTKGAVSFNGVLADGTKATQKTALSTIGQWPLYVSLHKGKGALVSWVTFDTNAAMTDFSGTLNWFKQTQTAKYFPAGFTNESIIAGSLFTKPVSTNWVLGLTSAVVGFTNGNLAAGFTNIVAIDAKGKVVNQGTNKLSLSASKSSGLFSGSATPPGGGKAVSFKGAVLQKQTNGFGFFLGTNASGRISLERQ